MKNTFKKIIITILVWESRLVLKKYKPKVIAITGSVGKTSTKDAIFTILSDFKNVRKSEKSFNSEIGVPLTILGLPNAWSSPYGWVENIVLGFLLLVWKHKYPEFLIIEIGAGKEGDIKDNIAKWLHPDVVIITRLPENPPHIEFFKDLNSLVKEKMSLAFSLKKDGILILNSDDPNIYSFFNKVKRRTVLFGENENATYRVLYPDYLRENENISGVSFKLLYDGNTFPVIVPKVFGLHYIVSIVSTIACVSELGFDMLSSIQYISSFENPKGRLKVLRGINNSLILDDTYNSSPVAMVSAINLFKEMKAKRKIAVIGDMLELGKHTEEEHRKIGEMIVGVADILVSVGPRAKFVAEEAMENKFKKKNVYSFNESETTGKFLDGIVEEGDLILLKGSQKIRLEKAVEVILEDKNKKSELLCRQEKEWKER